MILLAVQWKFWVKALQRVLHVDSGKQFPGLLESRLEADEFVGCCLPLCRGECVIGRRRYAASFDVVYRLAKALDLEASDLLLRP